MTYLDEQRAAAEASARAAQQLTAEDARDRQLEEERRRQELEKQRAAEAEKARIEREKQEIIDFKNKKIEFDQLSLFKRAQQGIEPKQEELDQLSMFNKREGDARAAIGSAWINNANQNPNLKPNKFGVTENSAEIVGAIKGALAKTTSSILTFPERAWDMTTGAYAEEQKKYGKYTPGFDPFGLSDYDPNLRTWWGRLLTTGLHYYQLGKLGQRVPVVGPKLKAAGIKGDLAIGFTSDLLSSNSQDSNMSQQIYEAEVAKNVPWVGDALQSSLGVLATKDTDHPWLKTLKNAVEGMGADIIIGKLLRGKGSKGEEVDVARKADVQEQIDETASAEMAARARIVTEAENKLVDLEAKFADSKQRLDSLPDGPEKEALLIEQLQIEDSIKSVREQLTNGQFSAYVNRDMADMWAGSPNSRVKSTIDLANQAKRLDEMVEMPGAGSTDAIFTPAQANRMATESGLLEEQLKSMAKDLLTDTRYQEMLADVKANRVSFKKEYGWQFARMQETLGRHATAVDAEDFWKPFFDDPQNTYKGIEYWTQENVAAADLVNASLFSQLRDLGIASRELVDVADIMDTDGPMKTIADRLIVGLTNVKRSRLVWSDQGRALQGNKSRTPTKEFVDRVDELRAESEAAVNMFMDIAAKSDNDAVARALAEAFSMSNKIQNWSDLDAYMRSSLTSMGINKPAGLMVRELQSVMTHSILSGPKTPVRAVMGTATASFLRPVNTAFGAAMRADWDTFHSSLASVNAYMQAIPEAFKLFRTNLNSYWAGDVADLKTRFQDPTEQANDMWALYGEWVQTRGSEADQAAYHITNFARGLNDNKFLTYSTSIMGATDDAFKLLMARARAREKAMRLAQENHKNGVVPDVSPEMLRTYEDNFYNDLLDVDGNIDINSDLFLKSMVEEATLTKDLDNFGKSLEQYFSSMPFTKPFFLFARTGINGLMVSYKNLPGIGLLHKEFYDIHNATPADLMKVAKYGINTAEDLANAKAMYAGRQTMGGAITSMAAFHYMNGGLTGNGPQDRRLRQLWMDTGWQPRSIKIGNTWVSYESFEPFNLMLSTIADIGDNMKLMGPQWAEQNFATVALATAGALTSKSYLSALTQLVDLLSGEQKGGEKIIANLMNNTMPLAGLRNELGKVISPYMREINNSLSESLRNRNLLFEEGPWGLPVKYDMLNGEKIREWNFIERMWNATSPVNLKMEDTPGRQLLWNSGYDLRLTAYSTPDGASISLADHPHIRSWFQEELGKLNLDKTLNELAADPNIQASVQKYQDDVRYFRIDRNIDPMEAYVHNRVIKQRFESARKKAWAKVRELYPTETNLLYEEARQLKVKTYRSLEETKGRLLSNI